VYCSRWDSSVMTISVWEFCWMVLAASVGVGDAGTHTWLAHMSPGGGAGQGGGGQAAYSLIGPPHEPTEMKLVAQLLAAEGQEVDVAARAEEGEDVELPPVSERKSLTAARLHLVSQGLVCVCWGR
jgi:hypothetical protein